MREALTGNNAEQFREAMDKEIASLEDMNTVLGRLFPGPHCQVTLMWFLEPGHSESNGTQMGVSTSSSHDFVFEETSW